MIDVEIICFISGETLLLVNALRPITTLGTRIIINVFGVYRYNEIKTCQSKTISAFTTKYIITTWYAVTLHKLPNDHVHSW